MSDKIKLLMRELGIVLVALGVLVLVGGFYAGLGFYVWSMWLADNYAGAGLTTGVSLIITGYTIRWLFRAKK
jgi:hypothetical protein